MLIIHTVLKILCKFSTVVEVQQIGCAHVRYTALVLLSMIKNIRDVDG